MKDITIIIPIHQLTDATKLTLQKAIDSVIKNRENYIDGILNIMMVVPSNCDFINYLKEEYVNKIEYCFILENKKETDFCSQINCGVQNIQDNEISEYFSILEYDDEYSPKWFKMAKEYYYTNEDVSVFLPVNVQYNEDKSKWQFCNELVLASSFSNEIGFIDKDCLENATSFNITGGIFNVNDFIKMGALKPSIQVAFNYEFLLRLTHHKYKIYVVPKEGYLHMVGRNDSLVDTYYKTMDEKTINDWFDVAKRECVYVKDRKKGILDVKKEVLK